MQNKKLHSGFSFQMAIGSDVAELLLKSKSTGKESDRGSDRESSEDESNRNGETVSEVNQNKDDKCIEKFCELLVYGHKKEALGKFLQSFSFNSILLTMLAGLVIFKNDS